MPATGKTNIGEIWKSIDNNIIDTVPFNEATDMENPVSEDEFSPPPQDDSTYNLAEDVTAPNVTPADKSDSKSDDTGDSIEEIRTDSSDEIIPKYLFQLKSPTRVLNIEFNRCLLLSLDPIPTTSWQKDTDKENILIEDIDTFSAAGLKTGRSSSPDSSLSSPSEPRHYRRFTYISEEIVAEEDASISTDCEVKSDHNSDETRCSVSLDSTETDKIIPSFLFNLVEDKIISQELELCFDFEDEATDNDILTEQSFSAKTDLYFEEDPIARQSDDTVQIKYIGSELDENKKLPDNLQSKASLTSIDSNICFSLTMDSTLVYEDDVDFIPHYLFAEMT